MAKLDWVSCNIRLMEEKHTVVNRSESRPVSYPEVEVLRFINGETAVTDIKLVKTTDVAKKMEEKHRLASIYGRSVVDMVYPGRNPPMEMTMPAPPSKSRTRKTEPEF